MGDTKSEKDVKKDEKIPCSVCYRAIEDKDSAAILTMGHFGTPRFLCKDCEELVNTAQLSHDVTEAEAAMARLGETVGNYSALDAAVLEAVENILRAAADRAEKIKSGTYDFSLDEKEDADALEEIPEELLETEEDKEKTEREERASRKFNKVMDVITAIVFTAAVAVLLYFVIK